MYRPKNCKKCGGKLQAGGYPRAQDYLDVESWQQAVDEYFIAMRTSAPTSNPQIGQIANQFAAPTQANMNWYIPNTQTSSSTKTKEEKESSLGVVKPKDKPNIHNTLMSLTQGARLISGAVDRNRDNQYDYLQQTALGQMNPMPAQDFQPNPYSLYAKYGGKLKTILADYNKWTNKAQFDFGSGDNDKGKMKKGGYELDRMLLVRTILPRLLKLGRLGTNKYQLGGLAQKVGSKAQTPRLDKYASNYLPSSSTRVNNPRIKVYRDTGSSPNKLEDARYKDDMNAKAFLKDYYTHAADNIPFYHDLSWSDSFNVQQERRDKYRGDIDRLMNKKNQGDMEIFDSLDYYTGDPELIMDEGLKKKTEKEMSRAYNDYRRIPVKNLMKPDDSLVFWPSPAALGRGIKGDYNSETNITHIADSSRAETLVHERAHKADVNLRQKGIDKSIEYYKDLQKLPNSNEILNDDMFDYLSNFSERQARHRVTQKWLKDNMPGYDYKKPMTKKEFDFLLQNEDKIPDNTHQLLKLYGVNPELFIKNLNSFEKGGTYRGGGKWIQKAVNPEHKGYCTPMTKSTCTPRRKALARTFKKHHGFHKKK